MHPLLFVYLSGSICSLIHTAAHALAGRAFGAKIEEVSLFGGPALVRTRLGGTAVVVKLVPGLGSHVKFRARGDEGPGEGFDDLRLPQRLLIIAAGSLALAAVALACLGPATAARSIGRGFGQVVRGGLAPGATGVPLVRSLLQSVRLGPARAGLGVVAAKIVAFNLLPLPPLNGGQLLWNLVPWRVRSARRLTASVTLSGLVAVLILWCGWLYAIARALALG